MEELIRRLREELEELENCLEDKDAVWQKSDEIFQTVRQLRYVISRMPPGGKVEDFEPEGLLVVGSADPAVSTAKMPYNLREVGRIAQEKKILPIDFTVVEICSCCTYHSANKK